MEEDKSHTTKYYTVWLIQIDMGSGLTRLLNDLEDLCYYFLVASLMEPERIYLP